MGSDWLITHEVVGHGFRGFSEHADVVRVTNDVIQELDPNYVLESSTRIHVCARYDDC